MVAADARAQPIGASSAWSGRPSSVADAGERAAAGRSGFAAIEKRG